MEFHKSQKDRFNQLLASRKQKAIARSEVSARTRFINCWHCICSGNVSKAMTEFTLALGTTYNTIVNPNAGARRKR